MDATPTRRSGIVDRMAIFKSSYKTHSFIRYSKDGLVPPVQFDGYLLETSDPDVIDYLRDQPEYGKTVVEIEPEEKVSVPDDGPVIADSAVTTATRGRQKA